MACEWFPRIGHRGCQVRADRSQAKSRAESLGNRVPSSQRLRPACGCEPRGARLATRGGSVSCRVRMWVRRRVKQGRGGTSSYLAVGPKPWESLSMGASENMSEQERPGQCVPTASAAATRIGTGVYVGKVFLPPGRRPGVESPGHREIKVRFTLKTAPSYFPKQLRPRILDSGGTGPASR